MTENGASEAPARGARSVAGACDDYDGLLDPGDPRFALIGEATHGTHECYRERARITRNRDVVKVVEWLRARNDAHAHPATKARFFGLDLYSLRASIEAVIAYLDRIDPE